MSVSRISQIPNTYRDSVALMELSRDLLGRPGVLNAAVMMGTPANLQVMIESGLVANGILEPAPDDIVIAVQAANGDQGAAAIDWATDRLSSTSNRSVGDVAQSDGALRPVRYEGWRGLNESARLAVISTPGDYAASEAWKALKAGRHVFLFSDHVSVEDEIALKRAGQERGLLVMGPECGTAIINGIPLGFANRVRAGGIGLVAASGSGLQEIVCLIDQLGGGLSHAIGTGGRDLSPAVGGLAMRQGIERLLDDDQTEVLILLSKPPDPAVADGILDAVSVSEKPVIVCFLGIEAATDDRPLLHPVGTLEAAAVLAVKLAGADPPSIVDPPLDAVGSPPHWLYGLFTGGTLAYEAMTILRESVGGVWSNKPLDRAFQLDAVAAGDRHICLDLGAEEYTAGRPHPMIDPALRAELLVAAARESSANVFLLDFVLGYGSHADPVGAMLPAIQEAQQDRDVLFVASVTGTDADPQSRAEQVRKLAQQGVIVAPCNASAARLVAAVL